MGDVLRLKHMISALGCLSFVTACSTLPSSGPNPEEISGGAATVAVSQTENPVPLNYALVDIDERVVRNAPDIGPDSFYRSFRTGRGSAPEILVGVGDTLQVTIFESKSGGLFVPADSGTRPGNYVSLPVQIVDRDGMITVPYADKVRAGGRRIREIQQDIEQKLAGRAIEPQVVVSITEQNSSMVSVVGEVHTPSKLRIRRGGERVLDVIAQAGGIRHPGYETYVTLHRNKRRATVFFQSLAKRPRENIYVSPGDTIYVYREPRRFLAFGANAASGIGASNQFNFDQERVSLAEGVAKAGGLLDDRANPGQIFLYRIEKRDLLTEMKVDLSKFPPRQKSIPTIYRANLRKPESYFFAQQFPLRMRDVLYVSNADSVEVVKFFNFVRSITSTVAGVAEDGAAARHGWRYVTKGEAPHL